MSCQLDVSQFLMTAAQNGTDNGTARQNIQIKAFFQIPCKNLMLIMEISTILLSYFSSNMLYSSMNDHIKVILHMSAVNTGLG